MTRADAYSQMLLLKCGFTEQFEKWFDTLLETEDPLSDETMELIGKGNDINVLISCLENISRGDRDEEEACRRVRLFFRDEYLAGRLTNQKCSEYMYSVSVYNQNFEHPSWNNMFNVTTDYDLAEIGIKTMRDFEEILTRYLETGEYLKTLKY